MNASTLERKLKRELIEMLLKQNGVEEKLTNRVKDLEDIVKNRNQEVLDVKNKLNAANNRIEVLKTEKEGAVNNSNKNKELYDNLLKTNKNLNTDLDSYHKHVHELEEEIDDFTTNLHIANARIKKYKIVSVILFVILVIVLLYSIM